MKRVLVIGSEGYLGSCLTDYLCNLGYECVGVDIGFFRYGVLYAPKEIRRLNFMEARNISDAEVKEFDVVVQLAGISNDPMCSLSAKEIYEPTKDYAIQIAEICKRNNVRYIFPSSCSVYGIGADFVDESGPVAPQTPYSQNKLDIENALSRMANDDFSPIALRLATVFGPSPRIRFDLVINMLCGMAITKGKVILNSNGLAWRPHIYIDDVCEAIRCAIDWNYSEPNLLVLNVGRNDNNRTILNIAETILKQVNKCSLEFMDSTVHSVNEDLVSDRKIQDGVDKRTYRVIFDKIHDVLPGYSAKWSVEDGIAKLLNELNYYRLNEAKFEQRDFYRLQYLEHLLLTGQISEKLEKK